MIDDIEDIIHNKKIIQFTKDLASKHHSSLKEYASEYNKLKKTYKLCPNKPTLNKTYYELLKDGKIKRNESFIKFSLKKKSRSSSGVSVITILTSPKPKYTDSNGKEIIQDFSCGHNCTYCPDEPELKITMKITSMDKKSCSFTVETNEDIHLIRLLTYIQYKNEKYIVNQCKGFTDDSFTIELKEELPDSMEVGLHIIGVKRAQPRSYLSTEPAVLRANRNNFDPILQIYDRADALINCGHIVDKIEILVLGGTWDNYPLEYQYEFIRDIYHSINTLNNRSIQKLSLQEEIKLSETSDKRIIGLTLETRPDYITLRQIKRLRKYNVTRLQIGVQHIDNDILEKIERGCNLNDIIRGNNLWKTNGGKIDWHIMPDLPGSSPEKDLNMFKKLFATNSITKLGNNYYKYDLKYPELQSDQLKIYPCSVVDWTKIKQWYNNDEYKPYSENEDELIRVLGYAKNNIFPWIRLNRIIRDIPNLNIIGGNENVNLRQKLLSRPDINCNCIRCREVKNKDFNIEKAELFIREYNGINSTEYFLSFESPDTKILYGFLRLRINHTNDNLIYKELYNCAFIRELHVYGSIVDHDCKDGMVQHMGFGKKLMYAAEDLTLSHNIQKIAVISGVGVREYYQKLGYHLQKDYMIKNIEIPPHFDSIEIGIILFIYIFLLSLLTHIL